MKISIVTISYNQAPYLEQAIRSVIDQDYPEIEYIVVDPGSTDNSRDIIERYRDKIDKIIFEPDKGPADGLNKGFMNATGDIYAFLNADDYLLAGALQTIVSAFQANSSKDILSGNVLIVDKAGKFLRKFYSRQFSALRAVYGTAALAQQATFFRAASFKKTRGFNTKNNIAWDGELWIEMALLGARFGRVNKFLAAFRIYPESISSMKHSSLENYLFLKRMFLKVLKRDEKRVDFLIRALLKIFEYLFNPRIFIERLIRGPALKLE